jgi:hypothetical protein
MTTTHILKTLATADARIPILLETPATVRWISAEPLLRPIDLTAIADRPRHGVRLTFNALTGLAHDGHDTISGVFGNPDPRLNWVVVGGETSLLRSRSGGGRSPPTRPAST